MLATALIYKGYSSCIIDSRQLSSSSRDNCHTIVRIERKSSNNCDTSESQDNSLPKESQDKRYSNGSEDNCDTNESR